MVPCPIYNETPLRLNLNRRPESVDRIWDESAPAVGRTPPLPDPRDVVRVPMRRVLSASWLMVLLTALADARAGEVTGRVTMPDICAPAVSPAVVTLEPASAW